MAMPAAIDRFRTDLAATGGSAAPLIAVSGGPDSLALLLVAQEALGASVHAATVDHGLRPAAAGEAAAVAALCRARGIPHTILHPAAPLDPVAGNVQARARAARYDALAAHARATGRDAILTAHHLDDQAETFLMRAARGAGVDGLSGVRPRGDWHGVPLLRPLLGWRRADLAAIVAAADVTPADDPTNHDPAHDRTRIRALLATARDLDPTGLARSAATLADASAALAWMAEALATDRLRDADHGLVLDPRGLPRELRRRLLVIALARLDEPLPRGPALDRLLGALEDGRPASIGFHQVTPTGPDWHIRRAKPRRSCVT